MLRTYAEEWAERYSILGPFDPIEGHECTTLLPPLKPPLDPAVEEHQRRKEIRDILLEQIRGREAVCHEIIAILDSCLEESWNDEVNMP